MIEFQNVTKKYPNGTLALNDVSLRIADGEFVFIVGSSGAGKSTLIKLMLREERATSGVIKVNGKNLGKMPRYKIPKFRRSIGVVFQEPQSCMDPLMKIGPQVEEVLRIHTDLPRPERKKLALEAMAQVELPEPERIYRKYPHELSGGMLQRVMIAAAIVSRPKLLLADEPTTALDVSVQAEILALLKKLNRETGMAILLISHDLHVVRRLCSRVAVMQRGKLVEDRPVEEIFRDPQHPYTQQLIAAIPGRDRHLF